MANNLKIALYQMDIIWSNGAANRLKVEKWLSSLPGDIDIAVLPETFSSGFSTNPELIDFSETKNNYDWLKNIAEKHDKAIVCSTIVAENGQYFNRMYFAKPDGDIVKYDKRHLFRMSNEIEHFTAGNQRVITEYKGFRILLQVCYDLRFPVWSRNCNDYDVVIYVASWPESRISAWDRLLRARAIENMCYAIGVNRVGEDPCSTYCGNSMILNYFGDVISTDSLYEKLEKTIIAELDLDKLNNYKNKFPAYLDADNFTINM